MNRLRSFAQGLRKYRITVLACTCGCGITGFKAWSNRSVSVENNSANFQYWKAESLKPISVQDLPNRREQLLELQKRTKSSSAHYRGGSNSNGNAQEYDVLVIGGGATGSGIALDAATRGLSVALVECNDFASGTSSKSTKLIHGGVRYLEKAIMSFDRDSWNLVKEAILERRHLINLSPHLSWAMPIIIPVYDEWPLRGWFTLIKHYVGLKIYEAMAGRDGLLSPTYYLKNAHTKTLVPHLKQPNMAGSIVYFDGIHNDSRMCLNIAMTAAHHGATTANYCQVVDFIKADERPSDRENVDGADHNQQRIIGVRLRDNLTGAEWNTMSKTVINATGCGVDKLRKLDNHNLDIKRRTDTLIAPSRGTHLILPGSFCSKKYGMLIPETKDGRVCFLLPFEGATICGTTDVPIAHKDIPQGKNVELIKPSQDEVEQIIGEINNYLDIPVHVSDIDAVWSGIRPLATIPDGYTQRVINGTTNFIQQPLQQRPNSPPSPSAKSNGEEDSEGATQNISRHHLIELSNSGLLTICGGKWTTYRQMAEDALDVVCELNPEIGRRATECVTQIVKLVGSANWSHCVPSILERHQIPPHIAAHLSTNYGDKAFIVGNLYLSEWDALLAGGYPYSEAEVVYCTEYEMAQTPIDILSRRTRLAQLNKAAAEYALPRVINIMGQQLEWNVRERVMHFHDAMAFLRTMHTVDRHKWGRSRHTLDFSRRVVETVLDGPSMTDEAIKFVIDRFWDYHSQNQHYDDADDGDEEDVEEGEEDEAMEERKRRKTVSQQHKQSRQLFEGCISRTQCLSLAKEFSTIFGDDRVIDSLLFTGQTQLGLYEILVSCAACAARRDLFDA